MTHATAADLNVIAGLAEDGSGPADHPHSRRLAAVWAHAHDLAEAHPKYGPWRVAGPFTDKAGRKLMAELEATPADATCGLMLETVDRHLDPPAPPAPA